MRKVDTRPEKLEARGEKRHWNGGAETKEGGKGGQGRRRGYQSLLRDQLYTDPGLRVVDGIMTGRGRRVKRCGELCL
jgi:hypothetical protein